MTLLRLVTRSWLVIYPESIPPPPRFQSPGQRRDIHPSTRHTAVTALGIQSLSNSPGSRSCSSWLTCAAPSQTKHACLRAAYTRACPCHARTSGHHLPTRPDRQVECCRQSPAHLGHREGTRPNAASKTLEASRHPRAPPVPGYVPRIRSRRMTSLATTHGAGRAARSVRTKHRGLCSSPGSLTHRVTHASQPVHRCSVGQQVDKEVSGE
jgi:hypothetical protein